MEENKSQEETANVNHGPSGAGSGQADIKGLLAQLEAMLDEYMIKRTPFALPAGVKEFIANVSPYLIILFAIMALPAILLALGLSAVFAPFAMMGAAYGHGWGFGAVISLIAAVVVLAMEVMAVPGLFKRTKASWRLLFYASIISLIGGILSISGIISGIIGAIIGWYILFQMKELYKN